MPRWAEEAANKIKNSKMSSSEKKKKEGIIWATVNKEINEGKLPKSDRPGLKSSSHHKKK